VVPDFWMNPLPRQNGAAQSVAGIAAVMRWPVHVPVQLRKSIQSAGFFDI